MAREQIEPIFNLQSNFLEMNSIRFSILMDENSIHFNAIYWKILHIEPEFSECFEFRIQNTKVISVLRIGTVKNRSKCKFIWKKKGEK